MASLLPHKKLAYDAKGAILVDGKPCASTDQRNEILASVDGMACKADDLLAMKKEEGRDAVAGKKVVYIYHNEIDSRGEKASTEGETFEAVRKAIDELRQFGPLRHQQSQWQLRRRHGRPRLSVLGDGTTETRQEQAGRQAARHRGRQEALPAGPQSARHRRSLARLDQSLSQGRGRHGVLVPQGGEPLSLHRRRTVRPRRGHAAGGRRAGRHRAAHRRARPNRETKTKPVGVQVLGVNHRITTPKYRFQLIQTEPVSERVKAITLKVAIYEGDEPVTNIETVTFDSTSDNMDERTKSVVLVLEDRQYNKKTKYRLVLRDAETGIEQASVDVIIDRAFTDDF